MAGAPTSSHKVGLVFRPQSRYCLCTWSPGVFGQQGNWHLCASDMDAEASMWGQQTRGPKEHIDRRILVWNMYIYIYILWHLTVEYVMT